MNAVYEEVRAIFRKGPFVPLLKRECPAVYKKAVKSLGLKFGPKEFYDYLFPVEHKCKKCGSTDIKYLGFKEGYNKYCSRQCSGSCPKRVKKVRKIAAGKTKEDWDARQAKSAATMQERHGVDHQMHLRSVKKKIAKTNLKKYGVKNASQSDIVKAKLRDGWDEERRSAHGQFHRERWSNLTKTERKEWWAKHEETYLKNFGVRHNMHSPEGLYKSHASRHAIKTIKFKGKKFHIQGFERFLYKYLHSMDVPVKCMHQDRCTYDWYDKNGKHHVYHPDLFLQRKKGVTVVEVKSEWTAFGRNHLPELKRKARAVTANGDRFLLLVFGKDGTVKHYMKTDCNKTEIKSGAPKRIRGAWTGVMNVN